MHFKFPCASFGTDCALLFKIANIETKKALTLNKEQHIIREVDANKMLTHAEMAKHLGLVASSLSKIM
jgi:hypothetical protein